MMRYNLVCMHWVVERLDEISKRIEEDIKMNPDVDVFCDVGVEDLRGELIYQMGVRAHETWKDNGRGKDD
jgi:hypothetical protein